MTDASTMDAFVPLLRDGVHPVPELTRRRIEQPVSKLEFPFGISAWLVTGFDDVRGVLGDTESFSNSYANLTASTGGHAPADQNPGGLGFTDPPDHTRLRRLLTPEFTMRRLRRLTPRITAIVGERLDAMAAAGGPVDLVAEFAVPVPSLVICELLDVPYPDRGEFQRLSADRFDLFGAMDGGLTAVSESLAYMRDLVAAQRQHPGQGLLGMLIREHGEEITDTELAGLADGVLVGGHETTASMLALGALMLLQNPDAAHQMRSDPDAAQPMVDELLRYLTVVQVAFPRFARTPVTIGGQQIAAGEMVLCSLTAPNRDPALSPAGGDLERFDPTREGLSHLAFGYGIHRCVGAELARMELCIAYPALLERFPTLRLAVPATDIAFRQYSLVHGVDTLPVTW